MHCCCCCARITGGSFSRGQHSKTVSAVIPSTCRLQSLTHSLIDADVLFAPCDFIPAEKRLCLYGEMQYPEDESEIIKMLEACGLHVLNQIRDGDARFYTVSESNVILWPTCIIVKTCGNINPLSIIKELKVRGSHLARIMYAARCSSESWKSGVDILNESFSGSEISFPDNYDQQFHVYNGLYRGDAETHTGAYVELVCEDIRPEALMPCDLRTAHIDMLCKGCVDTCHHDFEPCGYSMGALWKSGKFLSVHCSPNTVPSSYVSVELGGISKDFDLEAMIDICVAWLWPRKMSVRCIGCDWLIPLFDEYMTACRYTPSVPMVKEIVNNGISFINVPYVEVEGVRDLWVQESVDDLPTNFNASMSVYAHRLLYQGQSDFQKLEFCDTQGFGRCMLLDGHIQFTTRDELSYQEMLSHLPICMLHQRTGYKLNVLIVGGGDLFCAREVLKHDDVDRVVVCEIDPAVTRLCSRFMPDTLDTLLNPRCTVIHQDAAVLVHDLVHSPGKFSNIPCRYDVIIVDSSDPVGPAAVLYELPFITNVHRVLTDDGVVSWQLESFWNYLEFISNKLNDFRSLFATVAYGTVQIPTYPNGHIGLMLARKHGDVHAVRPPPAGCCYYTTEMHDAAFVLPKFVKDALSC